MARFGFLASGAFVDQQNVGVNFHCEADGLAFPGSEFFRKG
jgi:hypothetical protein